jgi:serine/threonine protein kinase
MITGRKPYVGDTPMSVIVKQVSEPLPSPRRYVLDLPENVEKMLARSLAKSPDERYSTASEFAEALERVQAKSVRTPRLLRTKPAKRLVDAPKTISTQMDDKATVDQFENTNEIEISATRKNSRKPDTSQAGKTFQLSNIVYVIAEDGIPLYASFPETRWNIGVGYNEELSIVESLEDVQDSMEKYGHYIEVIDKHGNKGFVPARSISFEYPPNRKIK